MTNRGNESAYPIVQEMNSQGQEGLTMDCTSEGMTIREKIAAQNMASLIGSYLLLSAENQEKQEDNWVEKYGEITIAEAVAKDAIGLADTLIAELSKPTEK